MISVQEPESLLPLTPAVLHILLALTDGERHGYSIMQAVAARTDGAARMGPGTLNGSLKRMLENGLVEELVERPDPQQEDVRRRYYRLTEYGHSVPRAELARLTRLVQLPGARTVLSEG